MFNQNNAETDFHKLYLWNIGMGCLHFFQGVFMLLLSKERLTQIYLYLPKPDIATRSFNIAPENWYQANLAYIISSFLFLSALAHFVTVSPIVYNWYIKNLKREINLIRWFEYTLSSTVMIYVIANLCGINDGLMLLALCSLNACMNLFGASMEVHNSLLKSNAKRFETQVKGAQDIVKLDNSRLKQAVYKPDWSNFIYGTFAGIIPWVIMSVYFFVSLNRLGTLDTLPQNVKDTLNTVKFIFPILFVFFNCFAFNMILQYKKIGWWKNYIFGEKAYIILSLVAKSFLAWFIWGGTLRP